MQFAGKLGFKTVAIARGQDEAPLAHQLGAHHYIDNTAEDPAAALMKLGGAKPILATATSAEAMNSVQGGLAVDGTLLVIGAVNALAVDALLLLRGRRSIKGWYSGTSIDLARDTGVQHINRCAVDERNPAARARGRRLPAHDQW